MLYAGLCILLLYCVKYLLLHIAPRAAVRLSLYLLALCLVVTVDYCFIEDWDAPGIEAISHWIGGPLLFFTIPTVSFAYDCLKPVARRAFLIRTCVEILIFPIWFAVVVWLHDVLGWVYF